MKKNYFAEVNTSVKVLFHDHVYRHRPTKIMGYFSYCKEASSKELC